MSRGLREQRSHLRPLEGDRGALRIVLVVRVRGQRRADDVLHRPAERPHPREDLRLLGGEDLAQVPLLAPLLLWVTRHAVRNHPTRTPIPRERGAAACSSSPSGYRRERSCIRVRGGPMLSDRSLPVVRATLPVVGENIGLIAERFYRHLFEGHPELLDGTFNRGNQAEGTQQVALAGSVAAFATALVQSPEQLPEQLLNRIAHKHASLGIRPDQYHVVHDNLFWAIADVLGDAVTPEVAAAWDEVYWLMAYALIHQERGLYSARGVRPEKVWRDWRVVERIQETDDVVTFVVKRIDDRLVRTSLPGQYVTVRMLMPDGVRRPRRYSLTPADDGEHRRFSVKQVRGEGKPDGEVSTLLCESIGVGDVLTMSLPFGDVVLDDSG